MNMTLDTRSMQCGKIYRFRHKITGITFQTKCIQTPFHGKWRDFVETYIQPEFILSMRSIFEEELEEYEEDLGGDVKFNEEAFLEFLSLRMFWTNYHFERLCLIEEPNDLIECKYPHILKDLWISRDDYEIF